jgi:molybdopterin-containing oxidoreductase family molybdopterin binding subunit
MADVKAGIKEDVWIPTACDMCYNGCTVQVHRVDGVAVKVEGIPEAGPNHGMTCAKGLSALMNVYSPNRVQYPMVRTNPEKGLDVDPGWKEISWDEALDLMASKLKKAMDKDPRSILVHTFDRYTYAVAKGFATAVGTPNVTMGSAGIFCGNGTHPVAFTLTASNEIHDDLKYCNHLLMFGASAGFVGGHNAMAYSIEMQDARARGMKLTVVDPVLNYAASHADEWIPIRPGTDAAFSLAMMREWVIVLDKYDKTFLKRHTNAGYLIGPDGRYIRDKASGKPLVGIAATGATMPFDAAPSDDVALEGSFMVDGKEVCPSFVAFKGHLEPYTAEYASKITSIPAATITRVARELVEAASIGQTITLEGDVYPLRGAAVSWYRGVSAHRHAMQTGQTMGQLNLLLGAVDVPGGVLNSSSAGPTWKPNLDPDGFIYPGNPLAGHMKPALPRRKVSAPETLELMEMFPVSVYARAMLWLGLLEGDKFGLPYKCDVLIQCRGNVFHTSGDPETLGEAFKTIDFVVSINTFPDETTRYADLVLPDAHSLERLTPLVGNPNNFTNSPSVEESGTWNIQQPVVQAVPLARNWGEVLMDVADRIGITADMNTALNAACHITGDYQLRRDKKYTWEEFADQWTKSTVGEEFGLDYFKEHGYLNESKRQAKYAYPLIHHGGRIPLYLEHYLDAGDAVKAYTDSRGIDWDVSDYSALMDYKPCLTEEQAPAQYDMWIVNQKLPFLAGTYSAENANLMDLAKRNSKIFNIGINRATAARKGIQEGDTIILETPQGKKASGVARLTEGIHPECLSAPGMFGRKSAGNLDAVGRGIHFNSLVAFSLDHMDHVSAALDSCVKVKVSKAN